MGTTLVCACLDGSRILIGNVGDSRAYLIREGACLQITQDHSLLDEQLRSGMITPEMAANSSLQSVITRAIGAAETVEPDFFAADLQPEDILLLATDGLTRYLQPEEIASIASATGGITRDLSQPGRSYQAAWRRGQHHLHRAARHRSGSRRPVTNPLIT